MIFLPSGVSFTLWQAALLRYLSGYVGWPVPLTPKAKRYFLRVTSLAITPTKKYYCAVRSKSNHLTNLQIAYVLTLSLYLLITLLHLITLLFSVVV